MALCRFQLHSSIPNTLLSQSRIPMSPYLEGHSGKDYMDYTGEPRLNVDRLSSRLTYLLGQIGTSNFIFASFETRSSGWRHATLCVQKRIPKMSIS